MHVPFGMYFVLSCIVFLCRWTTRNVLTFGPFCFFPPFSGSRPPFFGSSGPSQTYPQRAYRNPLDRLVAFLDARHGAGWAIWEFRAEGTGYPDEAVYHRIRHFPWPDHHPPPFRIVPVILGGMRNWLRGGRLEGVGAGEEEAGERDSGKGQGVGQSEGGGAQVKKGENGDEDGDGTHSERRERSDDRNRVVVVHCKAGKGRSGTIACSYLIAECGWTAEDALARFTERRMRPGFGSGVSIPSQLRWVGYVDRWTRGGKKYVDRPVEIVEVHVWGLRHGVKVSVEGFVEEGRKIHVFHTFKSHERVVVEPGAPGGGGVVNMVQDMAGYGVRAKVDDKGEIVEEADYGGPSRKSNGSRTGRSLIGRLPSRKRGSSQSPDKPDKPDKRGSRSMSLAIPEGLQTPSSASVPANDKSSFRSATSLQSRISLADPAEPGGQAVIFKPVSPVRIPNSDVNISVERRNRAPAGLGLTMVTAVAHVWFNAFFEGNGPEQDGRADDSGVFEIEWDRMDGIKGSSQRGTRAMDKLAVVWRVAGTAGAAEPGEQEAEAVSAGVAIHEPGEDSPVPQMQAADWRGGNAEDPEAGKHLGLRMADPESQELSRASSVRSQVTAEARSVDVDKGRQGADDDEASLEGVKVSGPAGEEMLDETPAAQGS